MLFNNSHILRMIEILWSLVENLELQACLRSDLHFGITHLFFRKGDDCVAIRVKRFPANIFLLESDISVTSMFYLTLIMFW